MTVPSANQNADELERFVACVRSCNPFVDNRVTGLSADGVNVDDIHRKAFDQLTDLARDACDHRRALGAVVWGEAGIGKSHLLSRLARWAEHDRQACAIYLHNLQASPENLPRSLLKGVVSILTCGQMRRFDRTPLFHMALAFVGESLDHDKTKPHPWPDVRRAYNRFVSQLAAADPARLGLVDRTVFDVIYRLFLSAYRTGMGWTTDEALAQLAVRWLSGDYLDPAEADRLGLPPRSSPDEPVALADNQQIKQVLVVLSRLALSRKQPLILCFDQVDNLDDDQAAALSRLLEALLDSAPNLLVVTAGIQASLLRWRQTKVIQDSAWDRLAQFEVPLQRLSPAEGRRIIAARLAGFCAPFADLQAVRKRRQDDDLFPLGNRWAQSFFDHKIELRPREVINAARLGWQREQEALGQRGGPDWLSTWGTLPSPNGEAHAPELTEKEIRTAIDAKVAQKISEYCDEQRRRRETLPLPDADTLAGLIESLLRLHGGFLLTRTPPGGPDARHPYHLSLRPTSEANAADFPTWLRFLTTASAHSTTHSLRWLVDAETPPARILLVTEERCPLALGARGEEYLEELQRGGRLEHITLTFDDHAKLRAARELIGLARENALELELPAGRTRTVSEEEVIASYRRQDIFQTMALLRELTVH